MRAFPVTFVAFVHAQKAVTGVTADECLIAAKHALSVGYRHMYVLLTR